MPLYFIQFTMSSFFRELRNVVLETCTKDVYLELVLISWALYYLLQLDECFTKL